MMRLNFGVFFGVLFCETTEPLSDDYFWKGF